MRRAVLLFAFLPALAQAQYPSHVILDLDLGIDLHDAYLLYLADANSASYETFTGLGSLAAGKQTLDVALENPFGRPARTTENDRYALIGAYGAEGVMVSLNGAASASALDHPWGDTFPKFSESAVYGYLTDPSVRYNLRFFFGGNSALFPTFSGGAIPAGQLVKFSDGKPAGTVQVQAVPEPASLCAVGLGVALLRRRKRV